MLKFAKQVKRQIKRRFWSKLEAKVPAFNALFPKDVRIEWMGGDFQFLEGPVWVAEEQALYFSDIPASKILKLCAGQFSIVRSPSGKANGLTRDRQGRLVICEEGDRQLSRMAADGSVTVLVDRFEHQRLNSPNDVVVKSDGSIYFTDPPFGVQPDQKELSFQGVYRLSPEGELTVVTSDLMGPNGLAFSVDEKQLYVDDSIRRQVRVFDVQPDGTLTNNRLFCDMDISQPGSPDGMKIDREGRLFITGPGGIWVVDADGTHLGTIVVPEQPTNCTWGDADFRSLYITAQSSIYRVRVNTPGFPASA